MNNIVKGNKKQENGFIQLYYNISVFIFKNEKQPQSMTKYVLYIKI